MESPNAETTTTLMHTRPDFREMYVMRGRMRVLPSA